MYHAIVFLPLIGFLIAGLFGRQIGDRMSQIVTAGLVTDAVLAALCVEHGLEIVSADSDFARFTDIEAMAAFFNPDDDRDQHVEVAWRVVYCALAYVATSGLRSSPIQRA